MHLKSGANGPRHFSDRALQVAQIRGRIRNEPELMEADMRRHIDGERMHEGRCEKNVCS